MTVDQQFRWHLHRHSQQTGFELPLLLREYLVAMLAARIRCTEVIPEPSFAERYLQLYRNPRFEEIRYFADQCLFFVSLMPDYGYRRGVDMDYYAALGKSAYLTLGDLAHDDRYTQLAHWFHPLQRFLDSALHPSQRMDLF
jgi:hypothetical protein